MTLAILAWPAQAFADCISPAGTEGEIVYNATHKVMQFCNGTDWKAMLGSGRDGGWIGCAGPPGCPDVGDQCPDTSYFAGCNPSNARLMFIHPDDQSTDDPWAWDYNSENPAEDVNDGGANQLAMQTAYPDLSGYPAFDYCKGLRTGSALGHADWYLPSQTELSTIWVQKAALNAALTDDFDPNWYWSSTQSQNDPTRAYAVEFGNVEYGDGNSGPRTKNWDIPTPHVRCMRSEGPSKAADGGSAACPVDQVYIFDEDDDDYGTEGLWGDGTSVFTFPDDNTVQAFQFDGTGWTMGAKSALGAQGTSVWGDGTYVYVTAGAVGVRAYTYNAGTNTWSAGVTYNTAGSANEVWGDGTYIYVADALSGVAAFTFNGTAWTHISTYNTPGEAMGVWGDGTYIYVADLGSGLRALTFNGTAWTSVATWPAGDNIVNVTGDGTYIYIADGYDGLAALSFNGSAFSEVGGAWPQAFAGNVWSDGTYIYGAFDDGIAFTFDGANFTTVGYYPAFYGGLSALWSDGTYLYALNYYLGLYAFRACR